MACDVCLLQCFELVLQGNLCVNPKEMPWHQKCVFVFVLSLKTPTMWILWLCCWREACLLCLNSKGWCICICTAGKSAGEKLGSALCKSKGMCWHQTDWSLIYNLRLMVRNTLEVQAPPNKQTNSQTVGPYHWLSIGTNSQNWREEEEENFFTAMSYSRVEKLQYPPFIIRR